MNKYGKATYQYKRAFYWPKTANQFTVKSPGPAWDLVLESGAASANEQDITREASIAGREEAAQIPFTQKEKRFDPLVLTGEALAAVSSGDLAHLSKHIREQTTNLNVKDSRSNAWKFDFQLRWVYAYTSGLLSSPPYIIDRIIPPAPEMHKRVTLPHETMLALALFMQGHDSAYERYVGADAGAHVFPLTKLGNCGLFTVEGASRMLQASAVGELAAPENREGILFGGMEAMYQALSDTFKKYRKGRYERAQVERTFAMADSICKKMIYGTFYEVYHYYSPNSEVLEVSLQKVGQILAQTHAAILLCASEIDDKKKEKMKLLAALLHTSGQVALAVPTAVVSVATLGAAAPVLILGQIVADPFIEMGAEKLAEELLHYSRDGFKAMAEVRRTRFTTSLEALREKSPTDMTQRQRDKHMKQVRSAVNNILQGYREAWDALTPKNPPANKAARALHVRYK
ncbi:hypothetical protein GGI43DRAFT_396675 [Trichoderma evansii]